MSEHITVVIEYSDRASMPRFGAGMEALGGAVVAVQFNDGLAEIEKLREERDDADNYIRAIWRKDMLPSPMGNRLFDRLTGANVADEPRRKHL